MKLIHTSDFHLGAYVGPQCDDPYKRMENTLKCLDVLVETARQEKPDIILITGDIFHVAKCSNDRGMIETRVAIDYIDLLGKVAPVMVLYGTPNHDSQESYRMMINYFVGKKYPYIRFFMSPKIIIADTKSGPIQIAGLPGFDKGHFRAQFPGLSAEEENQVFTQQLSQIVAGLSAQVDPAIPSILMAHHTIVGCELDNGQHVFQTNEVVLDAATLDNSNFDLICLGHMHKAQRVEVCSKPVYYAGSIDAFTFNDEGHDKGFWIHNIEHIREGYESDFIEVPAREFQTFEWSPDYTARYVAGELTNIHKELVKDKVVRIIYTCDKATEKALDKKKLERDLYAAGAYYVTEIRPEKIHEVVNKERLHESLTVEDCLQRYLDEKKIDAKSLPGLITEALGIINKIQAAAPAGGQTGLFLPLEIEVRNYRSYAEEKLSFQDIFFAMVNGRNGSGKSSLFMDAIVDCLYEQPREGDLTGWIRNGEKSGSISFTFKLGGDAYRVTRTRQRSGKATLALTRLDKYIDSPAETHWNDISCQKLVDTQEKIIQLLGMDADTFHSCVLIMQDQYGRFMEAKPEDRMSVLANLLGLGVYEQLEEETKNRLTEVNREIKNLKADMEALEVEVALEEGLHAEKMQVESSLSTANDELQKARTNLNNYQAKLTRISSYSEEAANLQADVGRKLAAVTAKKSRKAELESNIAQTESFLQNEALILSKCAELEKAKLDVAAMDGKIQLLKDKQMQYVKVSMERTRAEEQKCNIESRLASIMHSLKEKEHLEGIVNGNTAEQDLEEMLKKESDYKALEIERQITVQKIASLNKQAEMLNDAQCIDISKAQCKFLKSAKEAKDSLEMLLQEQREIIKKIDAVGFNIYEKDRLMQAAKIYRDAKDRLAKIAADAATAEQLIKQMEELTGRIANLWSQEQALQTEIEFLKTETASHADLQSKIQSLQRYEDQKMQLPRAKQYLESTQVEVKQLDMDIAELQESIRKTEERLEELRKLTAERESLRTQILDTESVIKQLERRISELNQLIGTINAKLETIGAQKVNLEEKRTTLRLSAEKASRLQVLAEAFSQDGIPHQIIRDIVPELETAANEVLGQMTAGRMRLEFRTERTLKSNKAKEVATLDIVIIDVDHGELSYLSRSGGQKVRAALAVSFALAMVKASRVGLQLGMMFVDEPPFLDAEGVEAYCGALEAIHCRYPEMRIVAISHDENMKNMFPQQIFVEMTEQGSKVRKIA